MLYDINLDDILFILDICHKFGETINLEEAEHPSSILTSTFLLYIKLSYILLLRFIIQANIVLYKQNLCFILVKLIYLYKYNLNFHISTT